MHMHLDTWNCSVAIARMGMCTYRHAPIGMHLQACTYIWVCTNAPRHLELQCGHWKDSGGGTAIAISDVRRDGESCLASHLKSVK